MSGPGGTRIRPATVDDAPELTKFLSRLGLAMPEGPDAVTRHWRGLWADNPALSLHDPNVALGYVLEGDGIIRGFFGNIPQISYVGSELVRVSSARAWAVEKEYRGETAHLCEAFFSQPAMDLVLISSASAPAGKRCLQFGGAAMPQPDYGQILYWVVDAPGFLRAAFRKKGAGRATAWLLGAGASVPFDLAQRLRGRRPFAPIGDVTPVGIGALNGDFDALWQELRTSLPETLLACRSRETLAWYFGLGASADRTRFLRADRGGRLRGYAAIVREDAPAIGLKRIKIADLIVPGNDSAVVSSLLAAAYEYAIAAGCHVVELVGLPPALRKIAEGHRPYVRPMSTFPFFYKALSSGLADRLADPGAWYVTAFDGDTALL